MYIGRLRHSCCFSLSIRARELIFLTHKTLMCSKGVQYLQNTCVLYVIQKCHPSVIWLECFTVEKYTYFLFCFVFCIWPKCAAFAWMYFKVFLLTLMRSVSDYQYRNSGYMKCCLLSKNVRIYSYTQPTGNHIVDECFLATFKIKNVCI